MKNHDQLQKIAYAAVGASLAFVLLSLGSFLYVGLVGTAALASFAVAAVMHLTNEKYAAVSCAAAAALGFLVLPVKAPVLYFAVFFGADPIFRAILTRKTYGFVVPMIVKCATAEFAVILLLFLARPLGIQLPFRFVMTGLLFAPPGVVFYDFAYAAAERFMFMGLDKWLKKR